MISKRSLHLALCATMSLLVAAGAYALDSQRSSVHQTLEGLRWARQVASQVEGLTYKARESGEKDPIGWAVNYLAQGVEPRLIQVSKIQPEGNGNQAPETFNLERQEGVFNYTKIILPEDGSGVRVNLVLGYVGFLGCKSALAGDLLVLILFGLCFSILFLRTGRYFGFRDTEWLHHLISEWVNGAKLQLTRHGIHIREMVRQAQRLAVSSNRSRNLVGELRGKVHAGLKELHDHRQAFQEADAAAARAESLALNAAIEANRIGGDARIIADMATELHRTIQKMRAASRRGQSVLNSVEKQVEPWAIDADLAYHAFDEVKDATDILGQNIRKTTETLLGQAKLIRDLNLKLGSQEPKESRMTFEAAEIAALPAPLPPIRDQKHSPLVRFKLLRKIHKLRYKKAA